MFHTFPDPVVPHSSCDPVVVLLMCAAVTHQPMTGSPPGHQPVMEIYILGQVMNLPVRIREMFSVTQSGKARPRKREIPNTTRLREEFRSTYWRLEAPTAAKTPGNKTRQDEACTYWLILATSTFVSHASVSYHIRIISPSPVSPSVNVSVRPPVHLSIRHYAFLGTLLFAGNVTISERTYIPSNRKRMLNH